MRHIYDIDVDIHRVTVSQGDVNKNLYYVLLAADNEGNIGQMGNIVKAYMPRCERAKSD